MFGTRAILNKKNSETEIITEQLKFFANINQTNENAARASFSICEMIAKSSRPFTEGLFIKTSEILCPHQKKLFEGICLSPNTCRITDLAANVEDNYLKRKEL